MDRSTVNSEPAANVSEAADDGNENEDSSARVGIALILWGALLAVVVLCAAGSFIWYWLESHPIGHQGSSVLIRVNEGESADQVYSSLAAHGVISSALAFRISDLIHGDPLIRLGAYDFKKNSSFAEVRSLFQSGPNIFFVTVYPGFTVAEVAAEVGKVPGHSETAFIADSKRYASLSPFSNPGTPGLEGLLGTGSYEIYPNESNKAILGQMINRFDQIAAKAGLNQAAAAKLHMTPYQIVTVSSIVQKEGYIPANMGPVARVIYNRLASGTPLQMDSTVLYSLGQDGGTVTKADLKLNTPYNTYLHAGLPPTPICFPSPTAISAALSPPSGKWMFFEVVDKNGTEAFSDTFAQQLANEKLAQARGIP
jgi:UPF0755 protein